MEKLLTSLTTRCMCGEEIQLEEFILFIIPVQEDINFTQPTGTSQQQYNFSTSGVLLLSSHASQCHIYNLVFPSDWILWLLISSQNVYPKLPLSETLVLQLNICEINNFQVEITTQFTHYLRVMFCSVTQLKQAGIWNVVRILVCKQLLS